MPRKKEDLKLAWLQKSEEEKTLIRKKDAEDLPGLKMESKREVK